MAIDKFLGAPGGGARWLDGNDHSWEPVLGSSSSPYWDLGAPITVTSLLIKWHYGGAYTQTGDPGSVSGAAGAFKVEGSLDSSSWTDIVVDPDPVTTAGASYPGDFEHEYSFSVVSFRYFRFTSTSGGVNNDIYTISAFGPVEPLAGTVIDWDEDGFDDGDNDQIPFSHMGTYRITRGASAEITGGATVGSMVLTLINPQDTDLYNPLNASGPLFGQLRDGIPIWLGINADGAYSGTDPRGLFGGRITDITPLPVGGATRAPTVTIEAEDALGWYRRTPIRIPDAPGRSYRELREEMLDDADETRIDLANEILTMPLSSWDGDLLDGLEAINKVNGTRHYCDPADLYTDWYDYTTRNRQWRLDGTVDASVDAFDDSVTSTDGWTLSADTVTNQQKATVVPVTFTPSSTTVWQAEGLPWVIVSGSPRVVFIEFDDYVDSPILAVNHTGTAPTSTLTPFGRTAKLTISSSGTTTITGALVAGALARRGTAVSVVVDDTASQAGARGVRSGSEISGDFVGVLANAQGIAAHIVWRYADPQYRPTVTVENWLPYQFEIDLFDIISVTVAELQITNVLYEVVGLTHEGRWAVSAADHLHLTTYVLQKCKVQADPGWFVLDTSELDSTDILAH